MSANVKKILFIFCLLFAVFAVANLALAATGPDVGLEAAAGTGLSAANDPRVIAANIIRIVLGFLGIIAVGLIIYAGWLWMTAEGAEEKVEKAKKILIGAVIGLAICLASFAVASFILNRLLGATGAGPIDAGTPGGGIVTPGGGTAGLPGEGQSCLKDLLDTQCAAGQCAVGLSCSSSDCLCKKTEQPDEGESCDADSDFTGCQAVDCANNLVCSSNDNCSCIKTPLIAWVSPVDDSNTPNGAAGNFITIGGNYFGATAGQVIFMGDPNNASDDKVATFPNQVNPLCISFWQDNQIIAVVPGGAVSGPIKVIDNKNYYDTTDNNRGANIKDFLVNNIKRPGICNIDPASGGLDDEFNLQGSGFNVSPHSVFFGNSVSAMAANNIADWTNTSVKATVPNIKDGRSSVFVQTNSINSNNLTFTISNDANISPAIEYIEPDKGPAGQYITIYGRNFKTYNAQKSSVKFYLPADPNAKINAGIDFPEVCRDNWWHDTYIVVKVPKVNSLGAYKVEVTNTDNRTSLPADFTINNETPMPGLCLLNPSNGPVGWPVAANGERFGNSQGTGRVQYFNNKNGAVRGWADKKVDTNVPVGSVSGPFRIIDGQGYISNPLPFRVGKCSASSECESGEECCGHGTYWSGICRATGTCAQGSPVACAFGWTFSTAPAGCEVDQEKCDIPTAQPGSTITSHCCDQGQCNALTGACGNCPINKPDSCGADGKCCSTDGCKDGKCTDAEACSSYGLSQCSSSYFCPNSPGKCSIYDGGRTTETGSCDYSCNNFNVCKTDLCEYKSAIDKCAKKNQTCGLPRVVNYTLSGVAANSTANCLAYDGKNRWIMTVSTSCPDGWASISGGRCVEKDTTCSVCAAGFKCGKETASAVQGICLVDQGLCPVGSVCNSNNKCTKKDSASCECCCRIGFDSEDCCSPLKCEGKCGSDITDNTGTYGKCSGCAVKNADGDVDQNASNDRCNCSGTSGKFCMVDEANPGGVCQDCAQISSAAVCSGQGVGSCCVDAEKKNACRGGTEPYATGNPALNYCAYYECASGSCSNTPVAASASATYETLAECNNKCSPPAQPGVSCVNQNFSVESCDLSVCQGQQYSCLNSDGSGPTPPNSCGACCCKPPAGPSESDSCKAVNNNLSCLANKGECSSPSAKRGLCCGCSKDNECGDANTVGCGSDTCCHARPTVVGTSPADTKGNPGTGTDKVCRNSLITATFDQPMQVSTFKDNVIVVGEYGASQCPAGTKYLTAAYKPSLFAKIKSWLAKIPLANELLGGEAQASDITTGNFCAVPGTVSGYVKADKTTVMEFKPSKLLEADRKYYVIIKGESNISDAIHDGVLSQDGIGLKPIDEKVFNGVTFQGKIWSFTTKNSTANNNGICLVNSVSINPPGYLFNTVINDSADDSGADDQLIKDSDKIFKATAYYAPGQPIAPIENVYNWRWDWNIDDKAVVKFKNGENALDDRAEQTLVAQNVKEANTLVHAKATITEDKVNKTPTIGQFKENTAEVYVFLCANPWPAYKADGSWKPWRDASGNCTAASGNCSGTNFSLYYCRDAGSAGTADDLPAILSDSAVIRGSTEDILKEFYFFRENTPNVVGANLATTTNGIIKQGGRAGLIWQAVNVPKNEQLDKYLVYYGTKSGSYEQSIAAPGTLISPFVVNNLTNGVKYYFAVTAKYKSGAESGYSNETSFIPNDTMPPQIPGGLSGTAGTGKAALTWTANTDDTAIYKIYYGATSGALGASVNLDKSKCVAGKCQITISSLSAGVKYYFAVTALDFKANESSKSAEIDLTIL